MKRALITGIACIAGQDDLELTRQERTLREAGHSPAPRGDHG